MRRLTEKSSRPRTRMKCTRNEEKMKVISFDVTKQKEISDS